MLSKRIVTSLGVFAFVLVILAGCNKAEKDAEITRIEIETIPTTTAINIIENDSEDDVLESEIIEEDTVASLSQIDRAWRSYIRSLDFEDALYGILENKLLSVHDGIVDAFIMDEAGSITPIQVDISEDEYQSYFSYCRMTRDEILRCPLYGNIGCGPEIDFDDAISSGNYYGRLLGVSEDRSMVLAIIGNPVRITDDLLDNQESGSTILQYEGLEIDVSADFESVDKIPHPENVDYYLTSEDGRTYVTDERIVILNVADNFNISELDLNFVSDEVVNGWCATDNNLRPITIEGCRVMNFEIE